MFEPKPSVLIFLRGVRSRATGDGYKNLELMEILDRLLVKLKENGKALLATLNLFQWHIGNRNLSLRFY